MEDPEQPPSTDLATGGGIDVRVDVGVCPPGDGVRAELARFGQSVLDVLDCNPTELSILLCGDSFIRDLNCRFRGIDLPTDVLSFEQSGLMLGDVVISLDTARRQACASGIEVAVELRDLLLHGILHLLGRDHGDGETADEPMLQEQERLWKLLVVDRSTIEAFS